MEALQEEQVPPESSLKRKCTRIPWGLVKQTGRKISITPLKCKCWDCEVCGPNRQKQLQWTCRHGKPTKFITLTASPESGSTFDEQAQQLRTAWRTVRRRAKQELGIKKIEFLAVFETTKRGAPHLHIVARSPYIPQKWLSSQMEGLTHSPIVDIRKLRSRKEASQYITKYIAKAPERFQGCKRYWRSMSFVAPKKKVEPKPGQMPDLYYVIRCRPKAAAEFLEKHGFSLKSTDDEHALMWSHDRPPPLRPGHVHEIHWDTKTERYVA